MLIGNKSSRIVLFPFQDIRYNNVWLSCFINLRQLRLNYGTKYRSRKRRSSDWGGNHHMRCRLPQNAFMLIRLSVRACLPARYTLSAALVSRSQKKYGSLHGCIVLFSPLFYLCRKNLCLEHIKWTGWGWQMQNYNLTRALQLSSWWIACLLLKKWSMATLQGTQRAMTLSGKPPLFPWIPAGCSTYIKYIWLVVNWEEVLGSSRMNVHDAGAYNVCPCSGRYTSGSSCVSPPCPLNFLAT